jgi:hypothetical protein
MRSALFALMLVVSAPVAAQAAGPVQEPPPVCWFYMYQWTYYESTGGQGTFAVYPVAGYGTGMVVTSGVRPTSFQLEKVEKVVTDSLLRLHPVTDRKMPGPKAKVIRTAVMECPPPRDLPPRLE